MRGGWGGGGRWMVVGGWDVGATLRRKCKGMAVLPTGQVRRTNGHLAGFVVRNIGSDVFSG